MTTPETQPPVEEPQGYQSRPGFVKSRWENNAHYVGQFAGDPWHPGLQWALERFTELCPKANIAQIKEKFGELRFYYDLPADLAPKDMASWLRGDIGRLRQHLDLAVARTEGWCSAVDFMKSQSEAADTETPE